MRLSKNDIKLFYKLHPRLLFYANQRLKKVKNVSTFKSFLDLPIEEIVKVRNVVYNQPNLIDSFVKENPFKFSSKELDIILSWKNFVKGKFILFRQLKKHAIFLDDDSPPKAYGVLALNDTFEEMFGPRTPIMLRAVLLPFKGQIVYDGFLSPYRIFFGRNIRRGMNDDYVEAKEKFGVITSLPFSGEEKELSDADLLKFYLKTERNMEEYWEEITELIRKEPELLRLYHQEMGKKDARSLGRRLREIGVKEGWFAILQGNVVASGVTRERVEQGLQDILPHEKRDLPYIFHLRKRK